MFASGFYVWSRDEVVGRDTAIHPDTTASGSHTDWFAGCLTLCLLLFITRYKMLHARETNDVTRWGFPIHHHKQQYTPSAPVSLYFVGEINVLLSLKPGISSWTRSKHILCGMNFGLVNV
jgi:hypothetical protein